MTLPELNNELDKVIDQYNRQAGMACSMCNDDSTGEALSESHKATAAALSSFKAAIMTYLSQS